MLFFKKKKKHGWFYFSPDKHETKMKGVIYFQAIEEVYYDHLKNAHKVGCSTILHSYTDFIKGW